MDSTLLAALLGAAVASIGVTLAKDTKVSEFRQAWIDKLREDVAEFISLVSRAFDEAHNPYTHALAKKQNIDDLLTIKDRLNTVMYRIVLRLDLKDEKKSQTTPIS